MRNKNPFLTDDTVPAWASTLWANRGIDWSTVPLERRIEMAQRIYDLIKYLEDKWFEIRFEITDPENVESGTK